MQSLDRWSSVPGSDTRLAPAAVWQKKVFSCSANPIPRVINVDKNPAYPAAIRILKREGGLPRRVRLRQCKFLNNVIGQDHWTVKKRTWLAKGYNTFRSAWRTLEGIETVNMIWKGRVKWVAKSVCLFIAARCSAIGSPVRRRHMDKKTFIGLDVHKESISISLAEEGRNGPVRFIGVIPNSAEAVAKMAKRLSRYGELDFCYEAGGCGYSIYRQLTALGHKCTVVATSMIPHKPSERIKTDRRDSQKLAILHWSGDLTAVWVPDPTHEAVRHLVRARVDASMQLMRARQQLCAFLLRHGRSYTAGKCWTQRHRLWLARQTFELHAHQIVFQDYVEAVWTAQERRDALIEKITEMTASWSLGQW
jgi:hypothetical protein